MKVTVCRKSHFNAAHRLCNPKWNDNKNTEAFGVCNNPNYHGHNYDLIVKLTGEVDPDTGYVAYPNINILNEMVNLISATRAYEANVTTLEAAKSMYLSALEMGR